MRFARKLLLRVRIGNCESTNSISGFRLFFLFSCARRTRNALRFSDPLKLNLSDRLNGSTTMSSVASTSSSYFSFRFQGGRWSRLHLWRPVRRPADGIESGARVCEISRSLLVEREFPGGERELRSQFASFGQIGYRAIILTFGKFTVGGGIESPTNPSPGSVSSDCSSAMRVRVSSASRAVGAASRYFPNRRTASVARPLVSAQLARSNSADGLVVNTLFNSPSELQRLAR